MGAAVVYLVDTNIIIYHLNQGIPATAQEKMTLIFDVWRHGRQPAGS